MLDCTQLPKFDLRPWKVNADEDEIHLEHIEVEPDTKEAIAELSPELIEAAVERAKQELEQRKRFEYEVWRARKFPTPILARLCSNPASLPTQRVASAPARPTAPPPPSARPTWPLSVWPIPP